MAQTSNLVQINSISAQDMTGYNNQQTLRANYYIDWGISDRISIQDFHWTVSYKGSDNVTRNLYNQTGPESGALAVTILTNSIAPNVTNAKSVKITISVYCEFTYTYSGVIQYLTSETATKDVTLTFPESYMKPTGSFSLSPVNTSTISGLSGYVSGFCKIKATRNISLQYNATVKSWTVKIGSAATASVAASATSYESAVQNAVTSATNISVVCTLTDSRGYSISQTLTAALIPYHNPSVVAANTSAYRSTNAGVAADDGTYCTIKLKSLIARCVYNNVTQNDSVTIQYRYKSKAGSWSSYANVTGASNTDSGTERTYTHTGFVFGNGGIATNTSYDVELKITDKFGKSVTTTFTIPTETWAFHIISGGNGAAIGKAAENANQMQIPDGWRYYRGAHKVWDAGDITPVSKAGDTMTGNLALSVGDTSLSTTVNRAANVNFRIPQMHSTTAPSSDQAVDVLTATGSDNSALTILRVRQGTDGITRTEFGSRRALSGGTTFNTVTFLIAADGTRTIQVSNAYAWRVALEAMPSTPASIELRPATTVTHGGFIDFHYAGSTADYTTRLIEESARLRIVGKPLYVDQGMTLGSALPFGSGGSGQTGTTTVTTVSNIASASSGVTIQSASYVQWGKVAQLFLTIRVSTAVTSATTTTTICTLNSGKRPAVESFGEVGWSNNGITHVRITTGGVLQVYGTMQANRDINIKAVYLLP